MSILQKLQKGRVFSLSKGFTLIELLVVIAIIGILATVVLLQLGTSRVKARNAKRVADISQLRAAVELYNDDNGSYPQDDDLGSAGADPLTPTYIQAIPLDPGNPACNATGATTGTSGNTCYGYAYNGTTRYQLYAELEIEGSVTPRTLTQDGDINASVAGWTNGVNGLAANETTCGAGNRDCVYDVGQQ